MHTYVYFGPLTIKILAESSNNFSHILGSQYIQLSLRAVLTTSRRKKGFLLFFAHDKGLRHMFQK